MKYNNDNDVRLYFPTDRQISLRVEIFKWNG